MLINRQHLGASQDPSGMLGLLVRDCHEDASEQAAAGWRFITFDCKDLVVEVLEQKQCRHTISYT